MNIFRILFELFVLYLLYKLIFDFIIPVFKTTQQVKKQFRDMSTRMQDQMNQQPPPSPRSFNNEPKPSGTSAKKDDYIEFEEIK
jgi:hypothetical protein